MSRFCWVWWKRFCTPSSCKVSADKLWQNIFPDNPSQWQTYPPRCVTHYTHNVSVYSSHRNALLMANVIRNQQKWLSVERGRYAIATRSWDNRDVIKARSTMSWRQIADRVDFLWEGGFFEVKCIFHWIRCQSLTGAERSLHDWAHLKIQKSVYLTQNVYMHSTDTQRLYTHMIAYFHKCFTL